MSTEQEDPFVFISDLWLRQTHKNLDTVSSQKGKLHSNSVAFYFSPKNFKENGGKVQFTTKTLNRDSASDVKASIMSSSGPFSIKTRLNKKFRCFEAVF